MVAASKLDDREERVEHPILPDWKELVFPATIMAATVAFIKSERGRRWYESIGKSTPDTEKLAKRLFYGVGGTISEPTFWGPTLAFTLLDFIQPRALMRYRLQKENPPPSLLHVLKTFVVSYVTQYYVIGYVQKKFVYPMWRKGVRERDFYKMPSVLRFIVEFIISEIMAEFMFYAMHRLFHHPWLYKWIHKRHHENRTPFSLANLYADPIDVIFSNVPVLMPPPMIGGHPVTFWSFLAWRNLHGTMVHCGYDIPFIPDVRFHDYHHRKFDGNYSINAGVIGFDKLFGTISPSYPRWLKEWNSTRDPITHLEIGKKEEPPAAAEVEVAKSVAAAAQ